MSCAFIFFHMWAAYLFFVGLLYVAIFRNCDFIYVFLAYLYAILCVPRCILWPQCSRDSIFVLMLFCIFCSHTVYLWGILTYWKCVWFFLLLLGLSLNFIYYLGGYPTLVVYLAYYHFWFSMQWCYWLFSFVCYIFWFIFVCISEISLQMLCEIILLFKCDNISVYSICSSIISGLLNYI